MKKLILIGSGIIGILLIGLGVSNIRVEPPLAFQGVLNESGSIRECEFKRLTKHSDKFFVGIVLVSSEKTFRVNANHDERAYYESICNSKPVVDIQYHAVKRLMGPLRFWVDNVVET